MAYKLIGKDFTPHDVVAKVTGEAKYSEDFRADGMVFCRLLLSPMPHARVRNIDASEALKMDGVFGVSDAGRRNETARAVRADSWQRSPSTLVSRSLQSPRSMRRPRRMLSKRSRWISSRCRSLSIHCRACFPAARMRAPMAMSGMVFPPPIPATPVQTFKWTAADFAKVNEGQLPMGKAVEEWSYGDVDAGFAQSKVVYDETFVTASISHHSMEPRSCMAYWQNGKCFVHGSSQSHTFIIPTLAQFIGIKPDEVVLIAEYCGGGFGSKGNAYPLMAIPALMSKKLGKPVMMRISRAEEYFVGSGRSGFQGRIKLGFRADGKLLAADLYVVQEGGPQTGFWDFRNAGDAVSLVYQPAAMRWRGVPVYGNTPTRTAQRGPGYNQIMCAVEPLHRSRGARARRRSPADAPPQRPAERVEVCRQAGSIELLPEGRAHQGRGTLQVG